MLFTLLFLLFVIKYSTTQSLLFYSSIEYAVTLLFLRLFRYSLFDCFSGAVEAEFTVECSNGIYSYKSINHWSKEPPSAISAVAGATAFWFFMLHGKQKFSLSSAKKL